VAWEIVYHRTADGRVPALDFLIDECPPSVEADLLAALAAVADAPPPAFAGGGRWKAMHGAMGGYYEVRTTGPGRRHYRLFCLLERIDEVDDRGLERSAIAVVTGMWKSNATLFTDAEYRRHVRALGDDYRNQRPRRIAGERDLAAYLAKVAAKDERAQQGKRKRRG
jgi:hypothetical protein